MERKHNKIKFEKPEFIVEELATALYHANQKLELTNEKLCINLKESTEVFVNVSHDMWSPITAIRNSIEFLLSLESLDSDSVQQTLQLLYRKIDYLDKLINDVFLLSSKIPYTASV
jgi:signal transduction histidine kinase